MDIVEHVGLALDGVKRRVNETCRPQHLEQECQQEEAILPHRDEAGVVSVAALVPVLEDGRNDEESDQDSRTPGVLGKRGLHGDKVSHSADAGASTDGRHQRAGS